METLINNYKTWMQANSMAKNTIKGYIINVSVFLKEVGIVDPKLITEHMINEYFAKLKGKCNNQNTFNKHVSSLKSFLNFHNIILRLPKTKSPMLKEIEVTSEEDFETKILPLVETNFNDILRTKAVLYFLYYGGLRLEDASKVTRKQFDLDNNILLAHISKQNMEKKFLVPEVLKEILIKYFASEAEEKSAFNMNARQMEYVFQKLNRLIPELKLHPHKFRKSCATNADELGMNIDEIQDMMGHKNIKTTQIYVKKDSDRIRAKYLKLEAEKLKEKRRKRNV